MVHLMAARMRRWTCPRCGSGTNGPERPRRDDVRRYCLACSKLTGRLVERECAALERERAETRERSAAKTTRKRETARAQEIARRTVDGVDLMAEAKRIWRTPTIRDLPFGMRPLPNIELRRSTNRFHASGHCYYAWPNDRIVVTAGTSAGYAQGAMLHELVHAALGSDEGHSSRFWSMVRSAAKDAWPGIDFDFATGVERGWSVDSRIGDRLSLHHLESR